MQPHETDETTPARLPTPDDHPFEAVAINGLYAGSERGLQADLLAARALGGTAHSICTTLVMASGDRVTDVVDVPSDTVDAQLEHTLATTSPEAIKVGIVNHPTTLTVIFEHLSDLDLPVVMDATASGPSTETLLTSRTTEVLIEQLDQVELLTVRRRDAQLLVEMEINSLDDAQVAAQRLAKRGAPHVLLRCGRIKRQFFEDEEPVPNFAVDLYYDGSEFSVFEAPFLEDKGEVRGASSAFTMAYLSARARNEPIVKALQMAKIYVTQALRFSRSVGSQPLPDYFWSSGSDRSSRASSLQNGNDE